MKESLDHDLNLDGSSLAELSHRLHIGRHQHHACHNERGRQDHPQYSKLQMSLFTPRRHQGGLCQQQQHPAAHQHRMDMHREGERRALTSLHCSDLPKRIRNEADQNYRDQHCCHEHIDPAIYECRQRRRLSI